MRFRPRIYFLLILCTISLAQSVYADAKDPSVQAPPSHLAPIITTVGVVLTALLGAIATILSAFFASKAKNRSDEIESKMKQTMYLQVAQDPTFLSVLENQGNFLRSTNSHNMERCLAMLLAQSDFIMNQIRNHHLIVNLVDEKVSGLNHQITGQLSMINEVKRELEEKLLEISVDNALVYKERNKPALSDQVKNSIGALPSRRSM